MAQGQDTPELLAEQERLLNAIIAAEAADLTALSPSGSSPLPKRARATPAQGVGAALIAASRRCAARRARANSTPVALPGEPGSFSVAGYAKDHGLDGREIRKAPRQWVAALLALEQVLQALEAK